MMIPISFFPSFYAGAKASLELIGKLAAALERNVPDEGERIEPELGEGIYKYDATFDDCTLGSLIATLSPYMYGDFFTAENAQYIDSSIVYDAESGEIDIVMMMRVGLTVDGESQSVYQGLLVTLSKPGEAPEVTLGASFADIFDSLYTEEEGGEEGGGE